MVGVVWKLVLANRKSMEYRVFGLLLSGVQKSCDAFINLGGQRWLLVFLLKLRKCQLSEKSILKVTWNCGRIQRHGLKITLLLVNLSNLTSLTLSHCKSLVELPENIGQLASLTHLGLYCFENIKFLPDSIVNLSNLTSLTLSSCKSLVELPENIGQLASLTHLDLTFCENIKSLPTSIANLPKLTSLSLSSELPSNLGHFKKCLSHLSLHHCDWEELLATVFQLGSLTHLELYSCDNIKCLPNSIANLSNLTSLSLYSCHSLVELPANVGQLVSLTHFELRICKNIKSLPMSIANISKLTSLYLGTCDFLTELPSNLGQMKSLSHLQLNYCNNIKSLPDSMKYLCCLDTLYISNCYSLTQLPINLNALHLKLINCCPLFLPTGLINLKYLRVTVCNCSDESFANLKDPYSLQHLSISGCFRHNHHNIIKVPARLNQFVNLQVLSLHDGIRFVELPANLDGLAHLCLLDIRFSSIKCLPWSITKLRKLQHLMLPVYFRLETLPYELNNSVIVSVDERHVRKSWEVLKTEIGELPIPFGGEIGNDAAQNPSIISPPGYLRLEEDDPSQWIINNRNLLMLVQFLDLKNVKELTDSIMQFSELTHLYLYFTDDIYLPDNYFVTFTRLTHLSLDFSLVEIDESVIHSLSKLSNLRTLHLRSLESELPENFNMPVSLKHLSLSSCNMRPLYDSLEKLTNLRSLDLNSCYSCESLPPCMYIHKLRLVDCSFKSLDSLPIGLDYSGGNPGIVA
ncbi:probable leucine-rich repeat receptor-like protein kinase At1g35710 [Chenopodium quinoa]|uniref:probable leucine-rich repeat receptor-like protein kinase At1g35710 n=1 Tax=Chenopodium quinoa TaxID=63459 RepID=UPI000B77062B|nr:probable leucine-rich repeat receptor-like protein kinase At1g35710 [Chenopodium quinoa]